MDLRLTFNEVPAEYDRLRPRYTAELFADVIRFSALDATKHALEIGIGTGQATLPFLQTGCAITAVEIGDRLAQFSREKFAAFSRFSVINQDFELAELEGNSYDLVYSASAFHWIAPEVGLPKVLRLLKPGGVFAWISVQPTYAQQHMHTEIQKIYETYGDYGFGTIPFDRLPEAHAKQQERRSALAKYGFVGIEDNLYRGTRTLSASDYATLQSTANDHRAMPLAERTALLQKLEDAVNRCGGEFTFADKYLLCMGKKPAKKS
ncbi:MAG: class I SAM-dependent methyltransferase [Oscillospiraceae bacterium]|nr:class I SAM-dependent methyltransferase [Oscillospiraceae bacterium]